MSEIPQFFNKKVTRRSAINTLFAAGIVITTGAGFTPRRSETLSVVVNGFGASLTRSEPPASYVREREISDQVLERVYNKYFASQGGIVSKKAWMRKRGEGADCQGIGRDLAALANIYYESEKGKDELFDTYYERFLEGLKKASDIAEVNFNELLITLQISGQNQASDGMCRDVEISRAQDRFVPIARLLGQIGLPMSDYDLTDQLRPYGFINQHMPESHCSDKGNQGNNPKGRPMYDLIRFRSEQTIGMMDFEPSLRARAILAYGSNEAKKIFSEKYPQIVRSYQNALVRLGVDFDPVLDTVEIKERQKEPSLASVKGDLRGKGEEYIARFKGRLDIFAQDDQVLAQMGIDPDNLDNWQKFNRTDIWYQMVRLHKIPGEDHMDERKAVEEVKKMLKHDFSANRDSYYSNLISQQILNPRFLKTLYSRALIDGNREEQVLLIQMMQGVEKYEYYALRVHKALFEIAKEEGKEEYNSAFQQLASAATTRMLSKIAGEYDPSKKYEFYWHLYRFGFIREMSTPLLMVQKSGFAPDISIDPPYAYEASLKYLDEFVKILREGGMLEDYPSVHILKFLQTVNALKEGNFSMFPQVSVDRIKHVTEFYRFFISDEPPIPVRKAQSLLENLVNN